jgi:hypothetical protein
MKIISQEETIKGMEMDQSDLMGCIILKAFVETASIMFTPHMHSMLVDDLKKVCLDMMKEVRLNYAELAMVKELLAERTNGKGNEAKKLAFDLIKMLK